MISAYIKYIEYYIPLKKISNDYLASLSESWTAEKIHDKIGVKERFIADENEFSSDLAYKAAQNLIFNNNIDINDIDFLIYCTQSPDYLVPTNACLLQSKLNLKKSIGALDFNLGCSGYVYGLGLAKGLILSKSAKNILFITSETYSKYLKPNDISNRSIFGDGASASLISTTGIAEIQDFIYGTNGDGGKNLNVKNAGLKHKQPNINIVEDFDEANSNHEYLHMNGAEVFSFTLFSIPNLISELLNKNNVNFNEIDLFVFHQASKVVLDALRKKIGISSDKFFNNIEYFGNTTSSTIPIAINNAINQNRISKGNKVLIAGFGVGYSWAGTILQF